ncbi:MAG TPA: glycosyltransferase family 2 protein [Deferrisomatales bacterium]|nr:glycosyltransferase family 2 protein [Deferrisomatales bacterium]
MHHLSIVLPAYNEEENIAALASELSGVVPVLHGEWEVECIFVDDGSSDATLEQMLATRERHPELGVRIITLSRNWGLTAAMAAGFQAARGDVVATLDTDLQNDPQDLPKLLAELGEADVAIGIRVHRRDTFVKRASSRIANSLRNWATQEDIIDTGCSLKVYRKEYLDRLKLFTGLHRFLPTLLKLEGARVVQVPVNHRPRTRGVAKYHLANRLAGPLLDLLAVRWMQKRHLGYCAKELP